MRTISMRTMNAGLAISLLLIAVPTGAGAQAIFNDATAGLPSLSYENGMDVEAADIDADGDLDLIIANEFQPNVILMNNGHGVFTNESAARIAQPFHDSEDIAVADFDGDRDLDIIFVSEDDRVHEYYLNKGDGHFINASTRLPSSVANAVVAADLTGDGLADLVIGNAGQDFLLVNDGKGFFNDETATRLPAEEHVTQDVELADIDGDGDLDLIAGNEDGNTLLINDGKGFFTDETTARLFTDADMETRKVAIADVDRDGDLDILFANVAFRPGKNPRARLFINEGGGFFADATTASLPELLEDAIDAKLVDIDGDGDPDLLTGHFPNRPIRGFLNDGAGHFTESSDDIFSSRVESDALGLEPADLDGDGKVDLYVCNRGQKDRLYLHASASSGVSGGEAGTWLPAEMRLSRRD